MASINNTLRTIINSKYTLYATVFLSLFNIIGYLSMSNFDAIIIFVLLGFFTQLFTKNLILILGIPLIFTASFGSYNNYLVEGLDNKSDSHKSDSHKSDSHKSDSKKSDSKKSDSKKSDSHKSDSHKSDSCSSLDSETKCQANTSCKWSNNKCSPQKSSEGLSQLNPQWIKDEDATRKEFYDSLPNNVDDNGINEMTKKTTDLIERQKTLRSSMDKLLPIVDKTNEFMKSLDLDGLNSLMSNLKNNSNN